MITKVSALFRARAVDFDGLYRRHAPTVYRYAYAVLGNQADAEDVTQQTFLNAYRSIEQGTKPRKPENWLLRIAHNEVRRHFRKNGTTVELELRDEEPDETLEPVEPTLADVLRALQKLPQTQRAALVMREFEGRSYAEMAEILEISQSALEALLFRARRGLAEELEEALTCTEAEHAISRRLDGRLPRRESRRLKDHLHDCVRCVRFATLQKRQRSVLKGLSIMPIPASLFLLRPEHAAAAGMGGAATAGAGVGVTVVAKAAAVTAAVAVTGGVGYSVATDQPPPTKAAAKAARAAAPSASRSTARTVPRRAAAARSVPIVAATRSKATVKKAKKTKPKKAVSAIRRRFVVALPSRKEKEPRKPAIPAAEKPERIKPERAANPEREPKPAVKPHGRTKPKPDPPPHGKKEAVPAPPPSEDPQKKAKP